MNGVAVMEALMMAVGVLLLLPFSAMDDKDSGPVSELNGDAPG